MGNPKNREKWGKRQKKSPDSKFWTKNTRPDKLEKR